MCTLYFVFLCFLKSQIENKKKIEKTTNGYGINIVCFTFNVNFILGNSFNANYAYIFVEYLVLICWDIVISHDRCLVRYYIVLLKQSMVSKNYFNDSFSCTVSVIGTVSLRTLKTSLCIPQGINVPHYGVHCSREP